MKYENMSGLGIVYVKKLIKIWNNNRQTMFLITEPDQNGRFFGIIKIFYYDSKNCIQSKCIKISSQMKVNDVLDIFIDKIQSNRSAENFSFYATFPSGKFKLLSLTNNVLVEQLRWAETGEEGRFLVRLEISVPTKSKWSMTINKFGKKSNSVSSNSSLESLTPINDAVGKQVSDLFKLVPDGPLVSTIVNQNEALLKKGPQIINRRIEQLMQKESNIGYTEEIVCPNGKSKLGTLKIFGTSIFPEASYKTIIVSIYDDVRSVIREALTKFNFKGCEIDESTCYLAMITTKNNPDKKKHKHIKSTQREYYILDEDRPLLLQYNYATETEQISFHLRRKVLFESGRTSTISKEAKEATTAERFCAILCELSSYSLPKPIDHPVYISLLRDVIAIGSNVFSVNEATFMGQKPTQTFVLKNRSIHPLHCIISNIRGLLTITPSVMDADVTVDGINIYETTVLMHGNRISLGGVYCFELHIPIKTTATMSPSHWNKPFEPKKKDDEALKKSETLMEKIYQDQKFISLPLQIKFKSEDFCKIFEKIVYLLHNDNLRFKLSLSFIMYMAIIGQFENNCKISNSADNESVTSLHDYQKFQMDCNEVIRILDDKMIYYSQDLPHLLLWLANISEFTNFLRKDRIILPFTESIQIFFDRCIQNIMNQINNRMESYLKYLISAFFIPLTETVDIPEELEKIMNFDPVAPVDIFDKDEKNMDIFQVDNDLIPKKLHCEKLLAKNIKPRLCDIIMCFNEWLGLFCHFNVNPTFTVRAFAKLLSCLFIKLVDMLIKPPFDGKDISVATPKALKARIDILHSWAENRGIEISFEKHSKPLLNVIEFINAPKETFDELKFATNACDSLNGLQICTLLKNWNSVSSFKHITPEWIDSIGKSIVESEGYFEEDVTSRRLTYTQPFDYHYGQYEEGFISENELYITNLLYNTIKSLMIIEDLELIKSNSNTCRWNIRYCDQSNLESKKDIKAEYLFITIKKADDTPLGMKIVSIKDSVTKNIGIFVSHINANTLIHKNGRIHVGDQLMAINGCSLIGIDENKAANIIYECGAILKFEVLKNSAKLHGLQISAMDPLKYTESTSLTNTQNKMELNPQLSDVVASLQPPIDKSESNKRILQGTEKNNNEIKFSPENLLQQKSKIMVGDKYSKQPYQQDSRSLGSPLSNSAKKEEFSQVSKEEFFENKTNRLEKINSTDSVLNSYKSSTDEINMTEIDENLQLGKRSVDSIPYSNDSTNLDNDMFLPPRPPLPENYQSPPLKKEYC